MPQSRAARSVWLTAWEAGGSSGRANCLDENRCRVLPVCGALLLENQAADAIGFAYPIL